MKLRPCAVVAIAATQVVFIAAPSPVVHAAVERMELIHQDLALAPDATLTLTFHPRTPLAEGDAVAVTVYPAVDTRGELDVAMNDPSEAGRPSDILYLNPTAGVGTVSGPDADGNVTIEVPTVSVTRTNDALRLATQGVYPVVVAVIDASSNRIGELTTFVDRLALEAAEPRGQLGIAAIASITAPPAVPGTETPLPDDVLAQVDSLIAFPANVRLTVDISPDVLTRLDPDRLAQLNVVLARSLVVSTPLVPLDASSVAAAGSLKDLFTKLLRDGEKRAEQMSDVLTDQTVWLSPSPMTTAGAAMLRSMGVRLIVISADTYNASPDSIGGFFDDSQLLLTRLTDEPPDPDEDPCADDCMPTAVIDPGIETRLLATDLEPERRALYLAADLVVWRDQTAAVLSPVTGHTAIVGLSNGGVPDPVTLGRAVEMATATQAVAAPTDLSNFRAKTYVHLLEGTDFDFGLPPATPPDIGGRNAALLPLTAERLAIQSMLVAANGRPERWQSTIETLYSTSLTNADVAAASATLTAEFDAITGSIEPGVPSSFTLSGRRTSVPMRFRNTSTEELWVMLHLDSGADKLQFPENDTVVKLVPGENPVDVPVVARANGNVTVNLNLLTPEGARQVVDTLHLQAKVNTLTGLAQVITGGAVLILLTWWVRNLRRARRGGRSLAAMDQHPANSNGDGEGETALEAAVPDVVIDAALEADAPTSASLSDL